MSSERPSWFDPPERRDPNDADVLARARVADDLRAARRRAAIEGERAVCYACERAL